MEPHDRLRARLAGVGCTACGAAVPAERIEILAERETLAFVEFRCAACGSEALGLVALDGDAGDGPVADVARYGEFGPADEARLAGGPPLDADDVRRMHAFLAAYPGDLRSLVDGTGGAGHGAA